MAACAVEPNPRGDFPGWLAARGMKLTFAEAMERELGISDYEELLACAEDAQVTGELLGAARDRLPFAFYAVLRRLVLAMAPARQPRQRGANSVASDDARDERRAALDEDDDDAGACGPRCEGARASRAVLGSLLDAIVATLSSLSRELLHSAQRFRCLEPALEPGYRGSIGMAGSISPAENRMDADMVDDENVDSLADLQRDEMGMNGHSGSSHKPCAERIHGAHCDSGAEPPFLSIKVEQEDETEGDTAAAAAVCRLRASYSKPSAAEPQVADASSSQHSSFDSNFRVTLLPERDKSGSSPPPPLDCDYDDDKEEDEEDLCGRASSGDEGSCRPEFLGYLDGTALALVDGGLEGPGLGALCRSVVGGGFEAARGGGGTGGGGEASRRCEQCGRYFSCRSKLLVHVRRHTGERPYRCSCCGKTFAQAWNLVRHRRIHVGQKPYECQNCGQAFTQQSELQKHKCQSPPSPLSPLPPPAAVVKKEDAGCAQ